MASCLLLSLLLLFVYVFYPTIPTYFFNFLVVFYTCSHLTDLDFKNIFSVTLIVY